MVSDEIWLLADRAWHLHGIHSAEISWIGVLHRATEECAEYEVHLAEDDGHRECGAGE